MAAPMPALAPVDRPGDGVGEGLEEVVGDDEVVDTEVVLLPRLLDKDVDELVEVTRWTLVCAMAGA